MGGAEAAAIDILCVLLVGAAVIRPDNDLSVLTRVPGLVHIGVVSYGIYLLHMLAANGVAQIGNSIGLNHGFWLFVATTIAAVAVATISHATFESWILRQRSRWISHSRSGGLPLRAVGQPAV